MTPDPVSPEVKAPLLPERRVWEMLSANRPSSRQRLEAAYLAATAAVLALLGFVWLGRSASETAFTLMKSLMGSEQLRIRNGIFLAFIIPATFIAVGHWQRTSWKGYSAAVLVMSGMTISLGTLIIALAAAACGCGAALAVAAIIGGYGFAQAAMPASLCAVSMLLWLVGYELVNIASVERKEIDPTWPG